MAWRHNHATLLQPPDLFRTDTTPISWQPEHNASHALDVQDADLTVDEAGSNILPFH